MDSDEVCRSPAESANSPWILLETNVGAIWNILRRIASFHNEETPKCHVDNLFSKWDGSFGSDGHCSENTYRYDSCSRAVVHFNKKRSNASSGLDRFPSVSIYSTGPEGSAMLQPLHHLLASLYATIASDYPFLVIGGSVAADFMADSSEKRDAGNLAGR